MCKTKMLKCENVMRRKKQEHLFRAEEGTQIYEMFTLASAGQRHAATDLMRWAVPCASSRLGGNGKGNGGLLCAPACSPAWNG